VPLRLRLGLVFALATAAIVGVVGLGFLLQLRISLDASLDAGLTSRAVALRDQYATGGADSLRLTQDEEPVQLLTVDGRVVASSPVLGVFPVLDAVGRHDVLARARSGEAPLAFTGGDGYVDPTRGGGPSEPPPRGDEDRTRYVATVLADPEGLILVVGTGTDISDAADEHVEKGLLILGAPAVLIAGFGAWWLAGAALRPVERMRRQTAEISERDDGVHLAVPSTHDEIAALATTMNGLLDRLRNALAHERGFVADAGHELRTPLATLRAELELASRPGRSHDDLRDAITYASGETDRLVRLAEDLLLLARAEGDQPFLRETTLDLTQVTALAARGAATLADPRDIDVVVEGPDCLEVPGDPDRLRQGIDNLLRNAVHHSPDHGVVVVSITDSACGTAALAVADHGPGFPEEFLPHAFERFRRADTARARADGGSGLGLAIVDVIARAHHGRVKAANRPEGGAIVEIELPTSAAGGESGVRAPASRARDGAGSGPAPTAATPAVAGALSGPAAESLRRVL